MSSTNSVTPLHNCFTKFKADITQFSLPENFTFPFCYDPHKIAVLASEELQEYLTDGIKWSHNFGLNPESTEQAIGKMFGVLVVQNKEGEIGYLSAFSGKVADENHHPGFVPPVYDILDTEGFFMEGIVIVKKINQELIALENSTEFLNCVANLESTIEESERELGKAKTDYKVGKKERKQKRAEAKEHLTEVEYKNLEEELKQVSLNSHFYLKNLTRHYKKVVQEATAKHEAFLLKIAELKKSRKEKSGKLQQQIFENYQFLNANGEEKNLLDIFVNTIHFHILHRYPYSISFRVNQINYLFAQN